MKKLLLGTALGALGALAMIGEAKADFITADGWVSTEAIVSSATGGSPASLALATCHMGTAACTPANADVTFTINGINFDSRTNSSSNIGDNTPGNGWLGSSPFTKTGLAFNNGVTQATLMDPTIWEFTGTASFTTGQTFTFEHDDGLTMIVNGTTLVSEPGPTSPVTTPATYTGPTGNFSFDLVYTECCGPPAVLVTSLVGPITPAPEPASLALLGSALVGLGAVRRRRRKQG